MIRHISLQNWRAYRQLELDVEPGTTFLVAENGVGKSSLLEAVRWALGAGHIPTRRSMVRRGNNRARVSLSVTLPDGELTVTRRLELEGSREVEEVDATIDQRAVSEDDVVAALELHWSTTSRFLARSAFLGDDLRSENVDPDLRAQLCRAYSLDQLERAMSKIDTGIRQVSKSVRAAREELTGTAGQLQEARRALSEAHAAVADAQARLQTARADHAATQARVHEARTARERRQAAQLWRERREALANEATALLGDVDPSADLVARLTAEEQRLAAELEEFREQQSSLRAQLDSIEASAHALDEAGAACPVCLRALDDSSRSAAMTHHRDQLQLLRAELDRLDGGGLPARVAAVRELAQRASALGPEPEAPEHSDVEELTTEEAGALARVEAAAAALRDAERDQATATATVERITSELAEAERLTEQFRAQALLEAARTSIDRTIQSVLSEQLTPLAEEVNRRWQAVFADRPHLRLTPDGQISRGQGDEQLEFEAFSTGEQTVAKLMMRLTTLLATTKIPFCWIDEPLEHLDVTSRRLVGSTLAHLSAPGGLEQILVTTYEEPLARRLAELDPANVRLHYLRTSGGH